MQSWSICSLTHHIFQISSEFYQCNLVLQKKRQILRDREPKNILFLYSLSTKLLVYTGSHRCWVVPQSVKEWERRMKVCLVFHHLGLPSRRYHHWGDKLILKKQEKEFEFSSQLIASNHYPHRTLQLFWLAILWFKAFSWQELLVKWVDFKQLQVQSKALSGQTDYGQIKVFSLLFTRELEFCFSLNLHHLVFFQNFRILIL